MAARNGVADAKPGSILLVIHDFVARSPDELSLAKGDRIELIERDDDFGDGWFLGRHMGNGDTGLFPEVYTTQAPKGTLTGVKQQRHASEGPPKTADSAGSDGATPSPTQQRHLSGSAIQPTRPGSAASAVPQSPLAQTAALRTSLPNTTVSTPRSNTFNVDSPVMNETLSVINEHITDMHTPRSSFTNGNRRETMGSLGSIYSQPMNRMSYIPGHETDEDEVALHTEEEVMAWAPARVAEYLEDHGVEKAHCDVFKEQEISGEVLLAMDQSSIFIKEFELGPVGRRLKTWHKIKALQDEVKRSAMPAQAGSAISEYSAPGAMDDRSSIASDTARNRSSTIGTASSSIFPQRLEPGRQSIDAGRSNTLQATSTTAPPAVSLARSPSTGMSPLQTMTSLSRPENTYRPSAQNIRQMQHARRHSSIDSNASGGSRVPGHRKQPSLDKKWQPGQAMAQAVNGQAGAAQHSQKASAESNAIAEVLTPSSPGELDRGYFSDNQAVTPKRNVLLKKTSSAAVSPMGSRTNSLLFSNRISGAQSSTAHTSMQDPISPLVDRGASTHMINAIGAIQNKFGSQRSATSPTLSSKPMADLQSPASPVVTKLDPSKGPSLNAVIATPTPNGGNSDASSTAAPSPSSTQLGFFATQKQKLSGLRSTSEAVTKTERETKTDVPATVKEGETLASPTRTGSTTPSTETRSFDMQKSVDGQSRRTSTGSGSKGQQSLVPPTQQKRPRPKTKKATSAYTRGLEKISPQEQMKRGCDYSGWMKKKSGSLMSTWKSRLFILRGRRLSYYYDENDTEEKGLIDISFHRVLPATNETLTGIHAAVTGVTASPTSPTHLGGYTETAAEKDLKLNPPKAGEANDGLFIFKLVPPKSGLAKGVTFTKPTVHYFAVSSRQEGRLWMAALMKATIDRDEDGVVTTTYNQKTISLAKARARKERPPALKEETTEDRAELDGASDIGDSSSQQGLGIGGLAETPGDATPAVAGADAEKDRDNVQSDLSSLLPPSPTVADGGEPRVSDEKEVAPTVS